MFKAIYDTHLDSLQELDISSTETPDQAFLQFLSAVLTSTKNIRDLRLTWPNLDVPFIDCVPASIQRLALAVSSNLEARVIVDRLRSIHYRLPYLKYIRFEVINGNAKTLITQGKERHPMGIALPIQNLAL
jgi:hypothetical protein